MPDSNYDIAKLLNLKTNESIGSELAKRQLEVIRRSYDFLQHQDNNIIYIADEVGLGKTFIAIGIALMLRHHSKTPLSHHDLIIVPKKNLQVKWHKELNNFIARNYLPEDAIKQELAAQIGVYDKLQQMNANDRISIHRMSAFSALATPKQVKSELRDHLIFNILQSDAFCSEVILDAWSKGYFKNDNEVRLRKLTACLLNVCTPPLKCLIVDEAHNYKHGEGRALRNIITSTFLGAIRDKEILHDFPELKHRMKFPLAEKIICLSATPKDRDLVEIKRQFNCFTNQHVLKDANNTADVKDRLRQFLIRGNLNYQINGQTVSRNQCRVEHRQGNINKSEQAEPLVLEDNFESVCWQLLQYQSLKHLHSKNNPSFEIGMLAGFESYVLDVEKRRSIAALPDEYDLVADKVDNQSQDYDVVRKMIESHKASFDGLLPPHPKQTKMEKAIGRQMEQADKSLIFVRRVASAYELHTRLIARYEEQVVYEKQLMKLPVDVRSKPEIKQLISKYRERKLQERLSETFSKLCDRPDIKMYLREAGVSSLEQQVAWLQQAYDLGEVFNEMVKKFITDKKTNVSQELKQAALTGLEACRIAFLNSPANEEDLHEQESEGTEEEEGNYFFLEYFKKGKPGHAYKAKMYRENWFDIELLEFNSRLPFLVFDGKALRQSINEQPAKPNQKKHQKFQQSENGIYAFLVAHAKVDFTASSGSTRGKGATTFLTRLLTGACHEQMLQWIRKRANQPVAAILDDLKLLCVIIKNIFRSGSGRLAGFIAEASGQDFTKAMNKLLLPGDAPFHLVLKEVKAIIQDFNLLVSINFDKRDEGHVNNILKAASSPVTVTTGRDGMDRGMIAAQFRMPGFPYVLVTTDIFREGEDLHTYCQNIYHYGIAWNPSDMEQRTGRIDRINSQSYRKLNSENSVNFGNKVQVFYPYMPQSVEINQVIKLLNNIDKFTRTFNHIEKPNNYESKVAINEVIEASHIPKQITELLKSEYDVWEFNDSMSK